MLSTSPVKEWAWKWVWRLPNPKGITYYWRGA